VGSRLDKAVMVARFFIVEVGEEGDSGAHVFSGGVIFGVALGFSYALLVFILFSIVLQFNSLEKEDLAFLLFDERR